MVRILKCEPLSQVLDLHESSSIDQTESQKKPSIEIETALRSYQVSISNLEHDLQQISARLEATDKDRHRLRERLLTTASQLETAVAEAREKDRDRRSTIKAYKNKIQVQEQVRSSKVI